ncbi:MAG: hypothetical protein AAF184_04405 [Pseudomonadota bacterium]
MMLNDTINHRLPRAVPTAALLIVALGATPSAFAVGDGSPFLVDESAVPEARANMLEADSLDFTYHACTQFPQARRYQERGYLWFSSYQDDTAVVPSQLNGIDVSDYAMYMTYDYRGRQVGNVQGTPSGSRLNYLAIPNGAVTEMILDPLQDTVIEIVDCTVRISGDTDDLLVGVSTALSYGEKSETDGVANGDVELHWANWLFTDFGRALFGNPSEFNFLVMNGNVTQLNEFLGQFHEPEGSGNVFWTAQDPKGD